MFKTIILFFLILFNFSESNVCNVLSLSGGGSFAVIEIGILKSIQLPEYDIITGISFGSLNSLILSYYNDKNNFNNGIIELENFYKNLKNEDVYSLDLLNFTNKWSIYTTEPLKKTLTKLLKNKSYNHNNKNKNTIIGLTNLNTNSLDLFNINKYSKKDQVELITASSSIPFIWSYTNINNTLYIDGSVISNQILSGLSVVKDMKCDYYNITFINAFTKNKQHTSIKNIKDYIESIILLINPLFNKDISIINNTLCNADNNIGIINYYYPIFNISYSIFDMTRGKELFDIGFNHHEVEKLYYCT